MYPTIAIIPLASVIVDREAVNAVNEIIKGRIKKETEEIVNIEYLDIIIDERNIEDGISKVDRILKDCDGFILTHLTGGTSKIALEILTNISAIKPFALMAFSKFNSLPSALNTREKITQILSKHIHIPIIYEEYNILPIAKIFHAVEKTLERHNVLFLGPTVGIKVPTNFKLIRSVRVSTLFKSITEHEVLKALEEISGIIKINYNGKEAEKKAIALYLNLRRTINNILNRKGANDLPLVCIECYFFMRKMGFAPCLAVSLLLKDGVLITCQRDVLSLFLMLLIFYLTGQIAWIADLSQIDEKENTALFTHSCANLTMTEGMPEAIYHPISNVPYAVKASFKESQTVTIINIDVLTEKFNVFLGKTVKQEVYHDTLESNQMRIKLIDIDVRKLINMSERGHFAILYGDWKKDIERLYQVYQQAKTMLLLKGK